MSDSIDKAARAVEAAAGALGAPPEPDSKAAVVARIRARRGHLAKLALPADSDPQAAAKAAKAAAPLRDVVPVATRVLPPEARPFPRSATLRVLMRHPVATGLGALLLWKAGPGRLLVVGRLLLPLVKHLR